MTDETPTAHPWRDAASWLLLAALALAVGLYRVRETGPSWPDSPRYANAAAMIHGWLRSGEPRPLAYAMQDYRQYPGFNVPYHPPVYPGLMALAFLPGGVSYEAARAFVAVCLAVVGGVFYQLLRRGGVPGWAALGTAALLVTTPELVRWSRDTMSEVPSLALILLASWAFLGWLDTGRSALCWLAFALAMAAFLSRVLVVGVLPAWYLYALLGGHPRRLRSPQLIAATVLFLGAAWGWVQFVKGFSRFQLQSSGMVTSLSPVAVPLASWANVSYFPASWPAMLGWATTGVCLAGLAAAAVLALRRRPLPLFWACWLACAVGFQLVLALAEQRYYVYAMVALPGLAAALFHPALPAWLCRGVAPLLLLVGLAGNVAHLPRLPQGLTGYNRVAACLAEADEPGNVLMACWEDSELIFRFRAARPAVPRDLIRSDRTLAVRLDPSTGIPGKLMARTAEDVLRVVKKGRIRFLVTCAPDGSNGETRLPEMVLAHQTAAGCCAEFELVGRFDVRIDFGSPRWGEVYVWRYKKELPPGPSEIKVLVPTAGLELEAN